MWTAHKIRDIHKSQINGLAINYSLLVDISNTMISTMSLNWVDTYTSTDS